MHCHQSHDSHGQPIIRDDLASLTWIEAASPQQSHALYYLETRDLLDAGAKPSAAPAPTHERIFTRIGWLSHLKFLKLNNTDVDSIGMLAAIAACAPTLETFEANESHALDDRFDCVFCVQ